MNNNNYGYNGYYGPPSTSNYPPPPHTWGNWPHPPPPLPVTPNFMRPPPPLPPVGSPFAVPRVPPPVTRTMPSASTSRPSSSQNPYFNDFNNNSNPNMYRHPIPRNDMPPMHNGYHPQGYQNQRPWQYRPNHKRGWGQGESEEIVTVLSKKKKKTLAQSSASKNWSIEDAQRALEIEKEFNKNFHNPSLVIKFPDPEINREIVQQFHVGIESVHFQQPSIPRFCFVTLKEGEDADKVVEDLKKIDFGLGKLTVEKKHKEENKDAALPKDIDPFTLYVGNLGQEVTKDDMVKAFPNSRRIDIGFAKKMKYTRYAFVSFRTVDDCIKAFKQTHHTQMFNKSLIVRFRRLHGTIGMPGEPKQTPAKSKSDTEENADGPETALNSLSRHEDANESADKLETASPSTSQVSLEDNYFGSKSDESDSEIDRKLEIKKEYSQNLLSEQQELWREFSTHKPISIKKEIKTEVEEDEDQKPNVFEASRRLNGFEDFPLQNSFFPVYPVKTEPVDGEDDGVKYGKPIINCKLESVDDDDESLSDEFDFEPYAAMENARNRMYNFKEII